MRSSSRFFRRAWLRLTSTLLAAATLAACSATGPSGWAAPDADAAALSRSAAHPGSGSPPAAAPASLSRHAPAYASAPASGSGPGPFSVPAIHQAASPADNPPAGTQRSSDGQRAAALLAGLDASASPQPGLALAGGKVGLRPLIPSGPLLALNTSSLPDNGIKVATLEAPADLWERMRRGFAMPDLETDLVERHERWHAERPQNLERMVLRSSKYLFHIVEEVERRGLPMELALVPFIESAFNPRAVSPVKAAGLWQFMPATGRSFDLMQNAFRDDRRDVLASTNAALDYLERLHRMFGDWQLALAAYNWGNGNVQRAIRRNRSAGLGTGYLDLTMPDETRNYVPKLQAIENLIRDPQRLGVRLPVIGNHPFFDSVTLERDIDLALVAELAEVSEENLRQLNPAHNKPLIMAAGSPTILLPWDNALLFQERLRAHTGPLASWTAWRVPETMSLSEAAQRHGVSESELRTLNELPRRAAQVRSGSTLLVPRRNGHDADVPEHIADGAQILLGRERADSAAQARSNSRSTASTRVTVRRGDTLSALAQRHDVTVAKLRAWNQLRPNAVLRPGQVLLLRSPNRQVAAAPRSERAARTHVAATRSKQAVR